MDETDRMYAWGVIIVGSIVFIGSWIYCIFTYGFLFGVGLGWLPSAIVAVIAGLLWPLLAIIAFLLWLWIAHGHG